MLKKTSEEASISRLHHPSLHTHLPNSQATASIIRIISFRLKGKKTPTPKQHSLDSPCCNFNWVSPAQI